MYCLSDQKELTSHGRRGKVPIVAKITFRQTQWQATTLLRTAQFCSCRNEIFSAQFLVCDHPDGAIGSISSPPAQSNPHEFVQLRRRHAPFEETELFL